ncbi:MAG: ferredoxin [Solirubrobacterales bacterium]|nr:ferredoxin [Solirubrobacterales bacterium]
MSVRLRVNPITCEGHGLCAELLPELIRLDDWGYPLIDQPDVPPELLAIARRAADACPTLALLLEEARDMAAEPTTWRGSRAARARRERR